MRVKFPLHNKVVLITGASGGIGEACARALHAAGAKIVLTDLEKVDDLAESIGGENVMAMTFDVTDRRAADEVVTAVVKHFGGIDMVFANAGIACDPPATIAKMEESTFERIIDVNLFGVYHTVKACLPQIIERRGHVLITASLYSFYNGMINTPYAMSKAAVEMLGRSLRAELAGTGATAGVLYPGWVTTPISQNAFGGNAIATKLRTLGFPGSLGRAILPEKVASGVVKGVQQRAPRIYTPGRWLPMSLLRGLTNIIGDWKVDRDKKIQKLVRELEE